MFIESWRPLVTVALALLPIGIDSSARAASPAGKVFFIIEMGTEYPLSWGPTCLQFTENRLCVVGETDECGDWFIQEQSGSQTLISFRCDVVEEGVPGSLEGQATFDKQGRDLSAGGAALVSVGGQQTNFGFSGLRASRRKCSRLEREFRNDLVTRTPGCMERAQFGIPEESLYILPYPVGKKFLVSGSYCHLSDPHARSLAYDFSMPIGTEILAARAGIVRMVHEGTPDEPDEIRPNGFYIEHDDGTVGSYAHITQDGVLVEVGDRVEQGQVVAISGTSGSDEPHLHFMVYQTYPEFVEDDDVPVNFRNARGPLDERGGLMWGYRYRALPYQGLANGERKDR